MLIVDDTIVAISSALGRAARGIVRISGPEAFELAQNVLVADDRELTRGAPVALEKPKTASCKRTLTVCRLDDKTTCPAEVILFHAPHSYTTEDLVELHLPGSPALLKMVYERLLALGARQAQPGEFTARAFFNGRVDLSQAEAVAELIHARSDGQLRAAGRLLDGALFHQCQSLQHQLTEIVAQIEAGIDFSQEEDVVELIRPDELYRQLKTVQETLADLIRMSVSWEQLDHLPLVVLAGPANAGKSSLANALLGIDRSIISSVAGTTRDVVSAPLALEHGECLLIDTAGLGPVDDPLADQSQAVARQQIENADLIVYVVDLSDSESIGTLVELDKGRWKAPMVIVGNKEDIAGDCQKCLSELVEIGLPVLAVSAFRGEGLEALKLLIYRNLHDRAFDVPAEGLALSIRQRRALTAGLESLGLAIEMGAAGLVENGDIASVHLREVLDQLGTISGQVVTDDLLGLIFGRFCVGK